MYQNNVPLYIKFNKKTMKRLLFSHKVQKIAGVILLMDIVLLVATLFSVIGQQPIKMGVTVQSILLIVFYLSVFFCVFSQESIEDEITSNLRLKSISIVSLLGLAIVILLNIVQVLLPFSSETYQALKEWRMNHFWNGSYYVFLALLYLVVLKIEVRLRRSER